ncbi:General secretion pathway lipoprotein [Erwinia pyrifoliae Ep1/96]|nr:General secretion pathway lipoprotein [Erwinia sp. Ejp617]CAX54537.1 General secretion pathway lipoprotein [Erwinia pyrifoliae Ep1/96]
MIMNIKNLSPVLLIPLLTLVSCQNQTGGKPGTVPVTRQLDQLSSLVASASWLRQHCNRNDIPEDATLATKALALAKERGWQIDNSFRQQLAQQVSVRISALDADLPSQSAKCAALNQAAVPFIQYVQK